MHASPLLDLLIQTILRDGPMTFERFMDLALYHPEYGYYSGAARRTGRVGDFLTSVDVGPLFGELLARQITEMYEIIGRGPFDLVEAAASNGQLSRDILDALVRDAPATYEAVRLHLVETSAAARQAQPQILGPHTQKLASSSDALPDRIEGAVFANELLDALPCHAVVMTRGGLREVVVDVENRALVEREAALSTPAVAEYLSRAGIELRPGWRAEVNLQAIEWVRDAARRLARGFLVLIDYGHRASELYSASHSAGTRVSYDRHVASEAGSRAPWLARPGEVDITAHVDLTSIERAVNDEGLTTIAVMDQTYFLLGLGLQEMLASDRAPGSGPWAPTTTDVKRSARSPQPGPRGSTSIEAKRRLAWKTLIMPGGLGSTLKVMIFGRGVGEPRLMGCSSGTRLT